MNLQFGILLQKNTIVDKDLLLIDCISMFIYILSFNLYDTSTDLSEQIYYKPIYIVIAVFTMDGQYHFSKIKLNPHF